MITPMTRYSFILLSGEQEGFLSELQELGLVDITRSVKPVDEGTSSLLARAERLSGLIQELDRLELPAEGQSVPVEGNLAEAARTLLERHDSLTEALKAADKDISVRKSWGAFNPEAFRTLEEMGYKVHFHVCESKAFRKEWAEEYALQPVSEEGGLVRFVVIGEDTLPGEVNAPQADVREAEQRKAELLKEDAAVLSKLRYIHEHVSELEAEKTSALSSLDLALASAAAAPAAENTVVTLEGYCPTECEEAVTAFIEKTGVFYLKEAARAEQNPPISFRNNKFVKMFEVLTDMYGRPTYDGFDPTPFLSVFFLLFFAMCMGDAGYGLVLILIGLGMKKMDGFKDMSPLVTTLGIGTLVIGFWFHTFFSVDISKWAIFENVQWLFLPPHLFGLEYDAAMVLSLIVGVVHICLALIVKTAIATKQKGLVGSLGTWGWTLLIVGGVIVAAFSLAGVMDSSVTRIVVIALGIVSALGIFVFNDVHRNPLLNIGAGLWDTYNTATGLLGDVLSYLRLYALGLAGAMLGYAFNDLGLMVLGDGGIVEWIGFIAVVVVGHALNIAMCALGAFVHPLRLNFLEFFKNSGYEGAGRNFNPLQKQQ